VLRHRSACPGPEAKEVMTGDTSGRRKSTLEKEEEEFEKRKIDGVAAGGYLLGRHPECGTLPDDHPSFVSPNGL
jgi:serine/threonine-protein kinase CHEK2